MLPLYYRLYYLAPTRCRWRCGGYISMFHPSIKQTLEMQSNVPTPNKHSPVIFSSFVHYFCCLFCLWLWCLEPIVLGQPPYNHTAGHDQNNAKEYDKSANKRAFAFLSFSLKPAFGLSACHVSKGAAGKMQGIERTFSRRVRDLVGFGFWLHHLGEPQWRTSSRSMDLVRVPWFFR